MGQGTGVDLVLAVQVDVDLVQVYDTTPGQAEAIEGWEKRETER